MEKMATPGKRVFISLPKKYMDDLSKHMALDHGLLITDLNANINEGYLAAYFKPLGCVTMCKIKNCPGPTKSRLAYVRFSTEGEADMADWAGPHYIGGTECTVRRVVSPKVKPFQALKGPGRIALLPEKAARERRARVERCEVSE
uniref:RRM domain-containing protein n=1 Tax=Fundulus heteroclitus TaxID=8078 RepID=A0A3Q2QFE3_FUNHE